MKNQYVLVTALFASACASSPAKLGQSPLDETMYSDRPVAEVAGCVAANLNGINPMLTISPTHFAIIRNNGYGMPVVRWDFIQDGAKTRIEKRTKLNINSGRGDVVACATGKQSAS